MEDPENYVCQQEWIDELWKVAQRELATGFITIHQVKMNNYSANVVKFHNINLLAKWLRTTKRRKSRQFVNGTFSVSAMKLNFMVPVYPFPPNR